MSKNAGLLIRPATGADAEAIGVIQVECWRQRLSEWAPQWFVNQFDAKVQADKYAERIANPTHMVLVAEKNGSVIGFTAAKPNDAEPLNFAYQIGALYVHPQHEGQGAASQLLSTLLTQHRLHQIPSTLVWTFAENLPARQVYKKCGGQLLPYTNAAGLMDLDIPHVCFGWSLH